MQRIRDAFVENLAEIVPLEGKEVLEVGCGDGTRSVELAKRCFFLAAIDPSAECIALAQEKGISNARFQEGRAEQLAFAAATFDVVIFTLSLHHVPQPFMWRAVDEARRVAKRKGSVVFLEPGTEGNFFDAEIEFDACDGDERKVKEEAHRTMMRHRGLAHCKTFYDESVFAIDSVEDFVESMTPQKNIAGIEPFLCRHGYVLRAERRIDIFKPK